SSSTENAVQEPGRCLLEPPRIVVGACDQQRTLEARDQKSRLLARSPLELQVSPASARLEDSREPALVGVEEGLERALHGPGQRAVLRGEHPAEAHPVLAEHAPVELGISLEEGPGVSSAVQETGQRLLEGLLVALDEAEPEVGLGREVVVEARLGDPHLL